MGSLLADVRYGLRLLARSPGFTAVAVLTLALGIGANTAIFSAIEGLLLTPLPFRDPERLVLVWERNLPRDRARNVVNPANLLRWRERAGSFEELAAFAPWKANLSADEVVERVDFGLVTANLFRTLGLGAARGRVLEDADARPGAADVVVLSDGLWRRRFGADPDVVGRRVTVEGRPATVVGVLAPGPSVPPKAELWSPLAEDERTRKARGRWMVGLGRLKPGVSVVEARAEMEAIAGQLAEEDPDRNAGWSASVFPLHAEFVRDVRPALLVLLAAVALVALIGCANVANLLLSRAVGRQREMAVRAALGAGAGRLLRQLLTESLTLAALGGLAGVALAGWALGVLRAVLPAEITAVAPLALNGRVLAFTLLVSLASALLAGLAPALTQARVDLVGSLHGGRGAVGAGAAAGRLRRALVVGEVGLAMLLLAGAGLLARSFHQLTRVDPGFRGDGVLSLELSLPRASYPEPAAQSRFFQAAVDKVAALPGVQSAGAISWRPLSVGSATSFELLDRPAPEPGQEPVALVRMVTPDLLRTLGVPVRRGRGIEARDAAGAPRVVLIDETLAREQFAGRDPLGQRVRMEWGEPLEAEIVGVVADTRLVSLDAAPRATLYWPVAQLPNSFMTLLVRSQQPPQTLVSAVRQQVAALDPALPVANVETLDAVVAGSLRQPRFTLQLLLAFAATAALLAGLGLYGVVAYGVRQRTAEVGVRLALGARPADVVRLVLGDGLRLALLGVGLGLVLALAATRLLASQLYEVSPSDPLSYAAVAVLLVAVSLFAGWLPARRATRVDPMKALRVE